MEKTLTFGNHCINKNKFLIHKQLISIDKVKIKNIVLSKKLYIVKKVHISTALDR